MIENEPEIPELTGIPLGTTGKELREAREAKGWDINSVSESLHLRPAVLIAIEEGNYREVPELFLKGYVRSYGRLMGLEGDRLIRQLELELEPLRQEEAERQVESPIFHIEVKKRKKRRIAFWVVVIGVLAVAALAASQLLDSGYDFGFGGPATEQQATEDDLPDLEEVVEPEADVEITETAPGELPVEEDRPGNDSGSSVALNQPIADEDNQAQPLIEPVPEQSAESEAEALAPAAEEPVRTGQNENAAAGTGVEQAQQPALESVLEAPAPEVADAGGIQGQGTELQDDAQGDDRAAGTVAAAAPMADFVIEFSGDCWIEVRNGAGERVYAALHTEGDRLSQSAMAPVSFVIGNIAGIESFTFDGEPVEISEYPSRNGRSEITLDANSAN